MDGTDLSDDVSDDGTSAKKNVGRRAMFDLSKTEIKKDSHGGSVTALLEDEGKTCISFLDVETQAAKVVSKVINKSLDQILTHTLPAGEGGSEDSEKSTEEESVASTSMWPTIKDFSIENCAYCICDYLSTWDCDEDWLYSVDFVMQQSDSCSDFYTFEATWSIPTKSYPIPQATASVYFTAEVSRVILPQCAVTVTYMFEGSRTVHTSEDKFSESWLFDIVDAKLRFFQSVTF